MKTAILWLEPLLLTNGKEWLFKHNVDISTGDIKIAFACKLNILSEYPRLRPLWYKGTFDLIGKTFRELWE